MMWVWFALGAMGFATLSSLLMTKLEKLSVPSATTIFIFKAVAAGCLFLSTIASGSSPTITTSILLWLLLAGVCSNLGDIGQLAAFRTAPNPGYALGIIFTFPIIVALASLVLPGFDAEFSWRKLLGMILCMGGAAILATTKPRSGRDSSGEKQS